SPEKLKMAGEMGANVLLNYKEHDAVDEIFRLTGGRGVDASIECLGTQTTFNQALRVLKPGGTLSSLGVYSEDLHLPVSALAYGLGDHTIRTALCPGGKERMRRMMNVIQHGGLDLTPFVTHRFRLENIAEAYSLFAEKRDGVIKLAITP
ncbi:zinc-binding dehydrogenase, partial [Serratia marcescens]